MRPALILAALLSAPAAHAAAPVPAFCTVERSGQTVEGDCLFTPRKGGSFDLRMTGGRTIMDAEALSLDVTGKGRGTVRAGDDWGEATRDARDGACWLGVSFRICARGPADPRPDRNAVDPARKGALAARCHMGACNWVDQSSAKQIGKGTDAIAGRRVEVMVSSAESEHPGDYPPGPPPGLDWSRPLAVQYFCSTARPAFRQDDGSWFVLPLPNVWGVTEGVTTTYMAACHPGEDADEATLKRLGYTAGQPARDTYPDFAALTRP